MTSMFDADICIIGAGSGGLSVAAGAAQLGRNVVLIEKSEMGGDCLNTGCVPSKALIAAANRSHAFRYSEKFGIKTTPPSIDFSAVMDHVQGVIAGIAPHDSQERFEGLGVKVLRNSAVFSGKRQVVAGDVTVNAKHFIIATGSTSFVPPINGLSDTPYLTNETVFENRILPDHLIVIGGGPIGVELAQAHRRLGAEVTIIEGATILNKDDPELVAIVRQQLVEDGIDIIEGATVQSVRSGDTGNVIVEVGRKSVVGSDLLVAVGRQPTVDGLNLEAAGVAFDKNGIKVNSRLRTTNKRIYAIGDVIGGRQFTHVAGYHASSVIKSILFKLPAKNNDHHAPWVTYADPELAHVGLTEMDARKDHHGVRVTRWAFDENDRARAERDTRGFVKIVTAKNGAILGASIVGRNAGDLIQPMVMAVSNGDKIKKLTEFIAPYPTRSEASKRAGGAWYTETLFSDRTKKLVAFLSILD